MTPEAWGRGDRRRLSLRDYPPEVLELVDRKQGGRLCVLCREQGLVTPADDPLVVDHLQPLARDGDNHFSNLRWLWSRAWMRRLSRGDGHVSIPI